MRKTLLTVALFSVLLFSSLAGTTRIDCAKANFVFPPMNPYITLVSPTNKTYSVNDLFLDMTVHTYTTGYLGGPESDATRLFTCTLDGKNPENITITNASVARNPGGDVFFEGSAHLSNLTEGQHNLTVRVVFDYSDGNPYNPSFRHTESVSTVCFRIDLFPQHVSILTPENKTYLLGVPLQFSIDKPASWMGYSLDGQDKVTIAGNMNLPELSVGQHTLTLYANDASGNPAASETVIFTVADRVPIALFAGTCLAVVFVGVMLYFKRRRRGTGRI